jgi:hypothetical protein
MPAWTSRAPGSPSVRGTYDAEAGGGVGSTSVVSACSQSETTEEVSLKMRRTNERRGGHAQGTQRSSPGENLWAGFVKLLTILPSP